MRASGLLSVGEAAILLGSSRAHVVELCGRGLLPYVSVGLHRRLRRADVEALIQPALSREQIEVLWLHRAVAGKLVADPASVLAAAALNLRRLRRLHPEGRAWDWLDRWAAVLDGGPEPVLDALTSSAGYAVELRCTSPFAGVLSEMERRRVLIGLAETRRERARVMSLEKLERVIRVV